MQNYTKKDDESDYIYIILDILYMIFKIVSTIALILVFIIIFLTIIPSPFVKMMILNLTY